MNDIDFNNFTIQELFEYIRHNFIGFVLFFLVFIIIFIIDNITYINMQTFAIPSPIPGLNSTITSNPINNLNKTKKYKKSRR